MALADLVAVLRTDLSDPQGELFTDDVLSRCILKGVYRLARDLETSLSIVNGEVVPEPEGEPRELLLKGRKPQFRNPIEIAIGRHASQGITRLG